MSSLKPKAVQRLESEVEKIRAECDWRRGLDLTQRQWPPAVVRVPGVEALLELLRCESTLEPYLRENPPTENNHEEARSRLKPLRTHLTKLVKSSDLPPHMLDEARLLLAKLVYAQGHWDEALSLYQATNVEDIRVPGPTSHRVRMLAEAWAIYGICLEKIMPGDGGGRNGGKDSPPPLSPLSDELDSNPEKAVIQCFERSGDLSLLYLQECDKSRLALPTYQTYVESGQLLSVSQSSPSPLLDYATRRAPLLMLQGGDKQAAVSRFRSGVGVKYDLGSEVYIMGFHLEREIKQRLPGDED